MEKKTISARVSLKTLEKMKEIQEKVVENRMQVAGINSVKVNQTITLEWIIDYAYEKLTDDDELWPDEVKI